MKINKDRTGFGLTIRTNLEQSVLKDKMIYAAEHIESVFVPSDVIYENNHYKFYISHRQSLKDYIFDKGLSMNDFFLFLKRINRLFADAASNNIPPYDFIFDYECIFVGSSFSDTEFIYAPDDETYKDGTIVYNKCSDMTALISLHINYADCDYSERAEAAAAEVLRILSQWETDAIYEKMVFPIEAICAVMAEWNDPHAHNRLVLSWKWLIFLVCGGISVLLLRFMRNSGEKINILVLLAWLLLIACAGYLLVPEKIRTHRASKVSAHIGTSRTYKYNMDTAYRAVENIRRYLGKLTTEKKEVCNMKLNGDMFLKGINFTADDTKKEIHLGRDHTWADIPVELTFVSRKHATLYQQDSNWYIKDLKSTNGTFVNGHKLMPEEAFNIKDGTEICLGIPESKLIFRLP